MRNYYGKLFQNVCNKEIKCFTYNPKQDYYTMIQKHINEGYQQIIFTSAVMLSLTEHFLLFHSSILNRIEFVSEDETLNEEIRSLLERMKSNGTYWERLKSRLDFLSRYDSIDVKKIELRCPKGEGFLVTLQVNGIIIVSEKAYCPVAKEIVDVVRRVIN